MDLVYHAHAHEPHRMLCTLGHQQHACMPHLMAARQIRGIGCTRTTAGFQRKQQVQHITVRPWLAVPTCQGAFARAARARQQHGHAAPLLPYAVRAQNVCRRLDKHQPTIAPVTVFDMAQATEQARAQLQGVSPAGQGQVLRHQDLVREPCYLLHDELLPLAPLQRDGGFPAQSITHQVSVTSPPGAPPCARCMRRPSITSWAAG